MLFKAFLLCSLKLAPLRGGLAPLPPAGNASPSFPVKKMDKFYPLKMFFFNGLSRCFSNNISAAVW
ncbi:MAG: hypothetical protein M3Q97_01505, partial [Bacteroidota bacterium]|nr:hypothetical protein [Bacteroidota bacterium]